MSVDSNGFRQLFPAAPETFPRIHPSLTLESHRQPANGSMSGTCDSRAFVILMHTGRSLRVEGDFCGRTISESALSGRCLLKSPNSPGKLCWGDDIFAFTRVRLELNVFHSLGYEPADGEIRLNVFDPLVARLAEGLIEATGDESLSADGTYVESLILALAARVVQRRDRHAESTSIFRAGTLRKINDFIDDHLESTIAIADLARLSSCSTYHFMRLFRRTVGLSPYAYITERRIQLAEQLLRETRGSVSDVAYRLGFSSQSHFTTVFRRHRGLPPAAFRRQNEARSTG